jgi:hypothetical protein
MIVPFPNPAGANNFGLVDLGSVKDFCKSVKQAFPEPLTRSFRGVMKGLPGDDGKALAAVHQVGNYQCSVVANVEDLYTTIDWTKFTMPEDLEERLAVLRDEDVVPPDCGFVIAQATTAVQEDGFGVLFPGRHSFFPTCHEGNDSGVHDYDTVCYGFNMMLPMTDGNVEIEDVLEDLEDGKDAHRPTKKNQPPLSRPKYWYQQILFSSMFLFKI